MTKVVQKNIPTDDLPEKVQKEIEARANIVGFWKIIQNNHNSMYFWF